jgi:23S rRNA (guanosine2251-2'-O)-methyltransferase
MLFVTDKVMRKLLHAELLRQRLREEEALGVVRHPVSLLLYNIRSLYNVGSIFRTSDSALLRELVLCGYTPHPPRKEIEKTALGAVDTVPWRYYKETTEAIADLRAEGYRILALELTDICRNYDELVLDDYPVCLVLGNEITGVDDDILELCDGAIQIPMYGVKHSLNVGVAAGIAAFEAVRTWRRIQNEDGIKQSE